VKLEPRFVAKPWGRDDLPPAFGGPRGERIGELWYEGAPDGFPLLAKYLFTSAKLSVQVHPDDDAARARGLASGKEECWYVTAAEAGATIGIGTTRPVAGDELRAAALAGTIEQLIDWRPVRAGDHYYVPASTVHAIGPGVTLVEIRQASDITYRLYDYGRDRALHLDEAVDVADARPHPPALSGHHGIGGDCAIADGVHFAVRLCGRDLAAVPDDAPLLLLPLRGSAESDEALARPGDCLYAAARARVTASAEAHMLVAWAKR